MSERSNIRDVAAKAGVAVKTVSRVLNGHPYVSADTKARVEEAMRALDFRPSVAARILSGAKSNQIALIYDNHSPYYMFQIQTGCWDFCRANNIRLLAQPVDVADPQVGEQVRGLVSETHVDGIILSSPVTDCDPVLRALEAMDIPFVRISPGTNHALTSSVFMDDAQAADDMTTHLINAGHRRIGFIKGHQNHMASDDRLFGYRRALDRAGISYDPVLVCDGEFDFDSGTRGGNALLDLPNRPTAIFASNDDMAAGVLAIAHDRGINVPAELSVAGFDDTTLARTVWPPLTTIHQPMIELARTATEILIAGGDISHRRLPHTLVERASVAPPHRTVS
ncbi:MAG: LacI family transcriptional regulator [Novosphingobium sp. 16-62-11]|uniref:LacI family DNA-binding transcriptional regulator n=1 Tax=Novosphingobium sp. 17-62-19 TaxID=1970406 RepID=UPI000BD3EF21|nr:LacI family DNA-binding transcriptional regulator [Novosphingobium sp. 17-62-19]OYX93359.1 MAG: LacI family transcriptional regulator [Novosphingobium sp. 35-62-5]OYZ40486.1 MAG: LacI family transcriptional regulator [Novosphingobium sp. 16-62-11]OZA18561.1 MAG: LacI family transcriptional regulator [Novosphingobium sp. 17-62-19]HQS98580.1 LacI family DNA-binding transcriptional regulator [Novosphingobium sp.]